ncbi:uncharacterized protein LOC122392889 [Amphibalanus amphitrite]|uniref:uncharacterized protein LOC122392889 n=1 Tax=Amphibalanus amphitrite TaxID=1232801 RepID=UPI001C9001BC|nr:uncharacterized protein LOC122392889 [Amphibalanus amphitrite]XP_043244173.1 uncharacterized protein LOC122392889 [Amphibalanus amphitrite]
MRPSSQLDGPPGGLTFQNESPGRPSSVQTLPWAGVGSAPDPPVSAAGLRPGRRRPLPRAVLRAAALRLMRAMRRHHQIERELRALRRETHRFLLGLVNDPAALQLSVPAPEADDRLPPAEDRLTSSVPTESRLPSRLPVQQEMQTLRPPQNLPIRPQTQPLRPTQDESLQPTAPTLHKIDTGEGSTLAHARSTQTPLVLTPMVFTDVESGGCATALEQRFGEAISGAARSGRGRIRSHPRELGDGSDPLAVRSHPDELAGRSA